MQLIVGRIGLVVVFVLSVLSSYAQLQVRTINRIPISEVNSAQARIRVERDTLSLPFWDDFSTSSVTPDSTLWLLNTGALVNGTMGKASPTLNVVSFDGSDIFGNPHNPDGVISEQVDVLTSQPIDLSAIPDENKDSVFFSFYWQMGGLGEFPEQKDSLKYDFLDKDGVWNEMHHFIGDSVNLHDTFKKRYEKIELEKYFHSGFQFRFRTAGNSLGPYDAWHIDYVYLNYGRYQLNESIQDGAIASVPTSIFSQYTQIPYDVLFDFPDTIYHNIDVEVSTQTFGPQFVTMEVALRDTLLNSVLHNQPEISGNTLSKFGRTTFSTADAITSTELAMADADSLFLELEMIYVDSKDEPEFRVNDTVRTYHEVHHTLAYDDGSAEYAAGLSKIDSQIGLYFNIPSEDTLTAVDIYFPQFSRSPEEAVSPSGKSIVLRVLKDLTGDPNSVLRAQEFIIPGGALLNQFNRFTFDTPVIVSGVYYIAFQQFTSDYIGIGLDNNNLIGTQKIFVNLEGEWSPNLKVEGMVMIRSIFEDSEFVVSSVENWENELNIFPNPVQDKLTIQGEFDFYELVDLSGKTLKSGRIGQLIVSDLRDGIYFLRIRIREVTATRKVIIRH